MTAASAYHHVEDEFKVDFLLNARRHLRTGGKVILCEQILPYYSNENTRAYAIDEYCGLLRKYCSKGNRTKEAIQAIVRPISLSFPAMRNIRFTMLPSSYMPKQRGLR